MQKMRESRRLAYFVIGAKNGWLQQQLGFVIINVGQDAI